MFYDQKIAFMISIKNDKSFGSKLYWSCKNKFNLMSSDVWPLGYEILLFLCEDKLDKVGVGRSHGTWHSSDLLLFQFGWGENFNCLPKWIRWANWAINEKVYLPAFSIFKSEYSLCRTLATYIQGLECNGAKRLE